MENGISSEQQGNRMGGGSGLDAELYEFWKAAAKMPRRERYKAVKERLRREYPKAFPQGVTRPPLKVGILNDLVAAYAPPGTPARARRTVYSCLATFMDWYSGTAKYLRACVPGAARVGLNGEKEGAVTETQAAYAAKRLADLEQVLRERARAKTAAGEGTVAQKRQDG